MTVLTVLFFSFFFFFLFCLAISGEATVKIIVLFPSETLNGKSLLPMGANACPFRVSRSSEVIWKANGRTQTLF